MLVALAACIAATGCAVGPDYQPPEAPMPHDYAASAVVSPKPAASRRDVDIDRWWRALNDRELDALIDRAIVNSPTLEIALNRLQQARAQEAVVVGTALPAAGASAGGGWGTGSDLARGRASQLLVSGENSSLVSKQVN